MDSPIVAVSGTTHGPMKNENEEPVKRRKRQSILTAGLPDLDEEDLRKALSGNDYTPEEKRELAKKHGLSNPTYHAKKHDPEWLKKRRRRQHANQNVRRPQLMAERKAEDEANTEAAYDQLGWSEEWIEFQRRYDSRKHKAHRKFSAMALVGWLYNNHSTPLHKIPITSIPCPGAIGHLRSLRTNPAEYRKFSGWYLEKITPTQQEIESQSHLKESARSDPAFRLLTSFIKTLSEKTEAISPVEPEPEPQEEAE